MAETTYKQASERPIRFSTVSDMEIDPLYTPEDVSGTLRRRRSATPASIPYTRGVYGSMYRGRLWTMRQFAGFGLAEDTNERFHFLLEQGQDGLSTAFDMPTLMGYDADHERALGEVGREGVAVTTIDDMMTLFKGIPLDKVTTSMTVNCSASVLLAMYLVMAERNGVPWERVGGTIQNDMLKEFIAQKEWISPARAVAARRHRHDRVLREEGAAMACGIDLRLPHPRGRLDRGAGTRVHARRRNLLRRGRDQARPRRRRLRAASVVLLEPAQRLPRRGRQAARRAPDVGANHEGALRREESELDDAAHACADRGRLAHRAAADQQRRARRDPGARRRDGRRAVAAHQFDGRDARAADRAGGDGRAAHAADHRGRDRRHQYDRSARRQLRDRGAHRQDGSARRWTTSARSTRWAGC